jgi:hypothetical protein
MKKYGVILYTVLFALSALLPMGQNTTCADMGDMHDHQHHNDAGMQMNMKTMAGNITVNLETRPVKLTASLPAEIIFSIRDNKGKPVEDLAITHERLLHIVIVSRDFTTFAHIHPEDFGPITPEMKKKADYSVRYTFPMAGRYLIAIDSAVKGVHFSEHFSIDVSGGPQMGSLKEDFSTEKRFGDYAVTFSASSAHIAAGKETVLKYVIRKHGESVKDLEPYLAAPMHLAIIKADLKNFIHAHGEISGGPSHHEPMGHIHGMVKEKFGPEIEASVVFPVKGVYQVFSEIKHQGKVIPLSFMVKVN